MLGRAADRGRAASPTDSVWVELWIDEGAKVAGFSAEVDGIQGLPGENQKIEYGGIEDPGRREDERGESSDQANRGDAESIHDGGDGKKTLDAVEREAVALELRL